MTGGTKIIEITVSANGETVVQTKGFNGSACRDASKFIELALGEKTDEKFTGEFYQSNPVPQKLEQH